MPSVEESGLANNPQYLQKPLLQVENKLIVETFQANHI